MQTKVRTAIYGVNFTEIFTVSSLVEPFELTNIPILSTIFFWRNGVNIMPAFDVNTNLITISGLTLSDEIQINYTPVSGADWIDADNIDGGNF